MGATSRCRRYRAGRGLPAERHHELIASHGKRLRILHAPGLTPVDAPGETRHEGSVIVAMVPGFMKSPVAGSESQQDLVVPLPLPVDGMMFEAPEAGLGRERCRSSAAEQRVFGGDKFPRLYPQETVCFRGGIPHESIHP